MKHAQHQELNNIALNISGMTFDQYGGFIGLRNRIVSKNIGENLSDCLNYVLYKKRFLETGGNV
jgi:hypothetical protein